MFISVLDLFTVGIGPSSSHTVGPMLAAYDFREQLTQRKDGQVATIRCSLKRSLAYTGKGHASDRAVLLGLHGYSPQDLVNEDVDGLVARLSNRGAIEIAGCLFPFDLGADVIFDKQTTDELHPNSLEFVCGDLIRQYYSIGGGFVLTKDELEKLRNDAPIGLISDCDYPFESAADMLRMAKEKQLSIAEMKLANELSRHSASELSEGLMHIWQAMQLSVERGLQANDVLPGALHLPRRAKNLMHQLDANDPGSLNELLSAYAIAVNEENAACHSVVTAPTNGAAGVIPAVIYHYWKTQQWTQEQINSFLLTAAAIGGLIKHRSSISGAEVGCQGEVGSAAAMAAAGLCAVLGGTPEQVENAAEIALEHHLGMTCDPVQGLVQVPCIERNAFGAVKAVTAAKLALKGSGHHLMSLDQCIEAMRQTGQEMSDKYKETSLGGLAVALPEC